MMLKIEKKENCSIDLKGKKEILNMWGKNKARVNPNILLIILNANVLNVLIK